MPLERISTQPHGADEVLICFRDTDTGLLKNELLRNVPDLNASLAEHEADVTARREELDVLLVGQREAIEPDDQNGLRAFHADAADRRKALEDIVATERAALDDTLFAKAERDIADRANRRIADAIAANDREKARLEEDTEILKARAAREGKPITIEE